MLFSGSVVREPPTSSLLEARDKLQSYLEGGKDIPKISMKGIAGMLLTLDLSVSIYCAGQALHFSSLRGEMDALYFPQFLSSMTLKKEAEVETMDLSKPAFHSLRCFFPARVTALRTHEEVSHMQSCAEKTALPWHHV